MKSNKNFSIFIIYLLIFSDLNNCMKNININKNVDDKIDHVVKVISSSQDIFFKNLKELGRNFNNNRVKSSIDKHFKNFKLTYIINPNKFKSDIKDLYLDYNEFLESEDHKSDHDDIADYLHTISSNYENLNEIEKLQLKLHLNNTYDESEKNFLCNLLDNAYIYNNDNFNITNLVEMIPHYFADFKGEHTKPENVESYKLNPDFSQYLHNIHRDYNLSGLKKMKSKERRIHLDKLGTINKQAHKKHYEGFSSFLTEYVHESVINNDPLYDRYLNNNKHKNNNQFDFVKIKDFLKSKFKSEEDKIDNLNLREILRNKRKTKPRFQENPSGQPSNTSTEVSSNNSTDNSKENKKPVKVEDSKKINNKVKDNVGPIVGAQALLDEMKKKVEKEKQRVRIKETCNHTDTENQVMEIVAKKDEEAKKVNDEAQKLMSELDPDILPNTGKPEGASNMMSKIMTEFMSKIMELLVKHIPFFFFKICIPPGKSCIIK